MGRTFRKPESVYSESRRLREEKKREKKEQKRLEKLARKQELLNGQS